MQQPSPLLSGWVCNVGGMATTRANDGGRDGYRHQVGDSVGQNNPVAAVAAQAVAVQAAAAAAAVTNRPDWVNTWHDTWRGGGNSGPGSVPAFAAASASLGEGFSGLLSPSGDAQDEETKSSETSDARNALNHMLDEDPSERRYVSVTAEPYLCCCFYSALYKSSKTAN